MDYDKYICDATRKKAKLCKHLSCGRRKSCGCDGDEQEYNNISNRNQSGAACYWSPYPGWTWIPSWFDSAEKSGACTYRCEKEFSHGRKTDDEGVGKPVFPTQSRRSSHDEIASEPKALTLTPSYSVVGHPAFKIYRFRLPHLFLPLLDHIVEGCANHANSLPTGWM
jgi:hypothetical protein